MAKHTRDAATIGTFVERFAAQLTAAGIARMPARVFAALLAEDSGRLTAADLAQRLQASPAAISGAVKYLGQVNFVSREREPGTRRDVYRVHDDLWHDTILRRDQLLTHWEATLRTGVDALGPDTPAGRRIAETVAFFEFIQEEMPAMMHRWKARRAALRGES